MSLSTVQEERAKKKQGHNKQVFKQLQTLFKKMPNKLQEGR